MRFSLILVFLLLVLVCGCLAGKKQLKSAHHHTAAHRPPVSTHKRPQHAAVHRPLHAGDAGHTHGAMWAQDAELTEES
ncbi:hypothetical protein B566_EDAN004650 [Ephemera danica]|nr:hypothetical protein B566_EDAN004650 [Ephemera danica]